MLVVNSLSSAFKRNQAMYKHTYTHTHTHTPLSAVSMGKKPNAHSSVAFEGRRIHIFKLFKVIFADPAVPWWWGSRPCRPLPRPRPRVPGHSCFLWTIPLWRELGEAEDRPTEGGTSALRPQSTAEPRAALTCGSALRCGFAASFFSTFCVTVAP